MAMGRCYTKRYSDVVTMHSYKKKLTIIDTSINHNEHINFTLETQMGKLTLNGAQFFHFGNL
jgi:hypothetical protein